MTAAPMQPSNERFSRLEPFVWGAILLAAACTRLYDLGARVMSHDESVHAFNSFELFSKGVYRHDPTFHGPLLYHINAAVYYVFGASDFTARLAPALAGLGVVAAIWMFRPYLGRVAAAAAAALIAVSPTFLFYSRYIREDIYVVLFTLVWVYGAFRYLDDRRPRWLFVVTAAMALSFITKESSFISGAIIGSFFGLHALRGPGRRGAASSRPSADLAALMFALVLPFATGPAYVALGWNPLDRDPGQAALLRGASVAAGLFGLAAILAAWRLRGLPWARLLALFWAIQVVFFTGFFSNTTGGLITGVAGSVGYWLTQHEVARGSQPWFYYLVVGGLYEFLPLLAGIPAMVALARRLSVRGADPAQSDLPPDGAAVPPGTRRLFLAFTIWWTIGSWIGFGWAGERMPWLLSHQVLPLVLLAGWGIASLRPTAATSREPWITRRIAGITAVVAVLAARLVMATPSSGRDLESAAVAARWWTTLLLVAALLGALVACFRSAGRRKGLAAIALGLLLVLGLHTLRASLQLSFVNYDLATELLSYAQASPDVRRAMRTIEDLSERTAGAHELSVAFDDESTWPFVWYLRNYRNARTWGAQAELARSAPVILVGARNMSALQPYVATGYDRRTYVLYWWPMQGYADMGLSSLWASLKDPAFRRHLWRVFSRRDYGVPLSQWPLRREIQMFVRSDLAAVADARAAPGPARASSPRVPPAASVQPTQVIVGPFEGLPLRSPTALTVGRDGAWIVADGGNNRVVVLEPDGALRMVVGSGRFNEPWGVASGPQGELFVADTWNGRIHVFDRRGVHLRSWGTWGQSGAIAGPGSDVSLYGPRGLVLDGDGNLVVADTGNKRLLRFGDDGALRDTIGASSPRPVFFDEPASVATDANHTLLVADAWNQRIVRLDNRGQAIGSWSVPGWRSRSAEDKPSVAVDRDGYVYATDPESGRVLVFAGSGMLETILQMPGTGEGAARPTGIAVDPRQGKLLVVDHRSGRLLVYPLYKPGS